MNLMLSLDLGTTSVKGGLFSDDGKILASELAEYKLLTPLPNEAELPAEVYWETTQKVIRSVIQKADVNPKQIAGLCVSSQGETMVPVDAEGKPLRNAIVWIDNRAEKQAEKLKQELESESYEVTGIPEIVATWPGCKILWIKENEPEVFSRAKKFLLLHDYILYKLTGKYVTNGSISCTTLYFDIRSQCWWQKALDAIGINPSLLPEIHPAGEVIGHIQPKAAAQLGLTTNVSVIGGGMDQSVGAIGAGTISSGTASETTGSALCIQVVVNGITHNKTRMPIYVHSVPNKYLCVPVCPTAGMAYKWFKDVFAETEKNLGEKEGRSVYDILNDLAAAVPAGSDGLIMLPHLMGAFSPESNPDAKGSFTGFTIHHTKGHFVRAILESVAFMLKQNLDVLTENGSRFNEIRVTGGGAKSQLWNQIKADVCQLPVVQLENEETGLLGDAILTARALGSFASIEEGCEKMIRIKKIIYPGENVLIYEKAYNHYCYLDQILNKYYKDTAEG